MTADVNDKRTSSEYAMMQWGLGRGTGGGSALGWEARAHPTAFPLYNVDKLFRTFMYAFQFVFMNNV